MPILIRMRWGRYYKDVVPPMAPPSPPPPSPLEVVTRLFERAAEILGGSEAEPSIVLGVLSVIKGDYESAIGHMQAAWAADGQDYQTWNKLGAVQTHSSQKHQAATSYKKALEIRPTYRRAKENLIRLGATAAAAPTPAAAAAAAAGHPSRHEA
jgi:tetratricopeptide (TPR) repeat protein